MPPPTRPRAEPGYGKAYEHFPYEFVDEFKAWGHVGGEGGRSDGVLLEFVHEFVGNRPPTGCPPVAKARSQGGAGGAEEG